MRGAGCSYNDILDRDIDAKVERTANRPIPSGHVSTKAAFIWTIIQCFVGLAVLLCLPRLAQYIALASIPLVALYPLMKRITWWPQAWLGMTFSWASLVASASITASIGITEIILYFSFVFWVIGYDTIYALQDIEDDSIIGVKSTARRFGSRVRTAVIVLYSLCLMCLIAACVSANQWIGLAGVGIFGGHLLIQTLNLSSDMGDKALKVFVSNREAALLLIAGFGLGIVANTSF
jgi:4-hydroxybenzoate polyprenyltransferase